MGDGVGVKSLAYLRGERDLFVEREKLAGARRRLEKSRLGYWLCNGGKRRVKIFWKVVSLLESNSRMGLTEMSRVLQVPVSTVFDTLKQVEKFFCFTIALKEGEKNVLIPCVEFSYEFVGRGVEVKEGPLSNFV